MQEAVAAIQASLPEAAHENAYITDNLFVTVYNG
jgi:hypothetical protein